MKLINRIIIRILLAVTLVLGLWAFFFYSIMMTEITDEVDDSLEDYSELIIIRSLAGELDSVKHDGTNNTYSLKQISKEYAKRNETIVYADSSVYIPQKRETEPARVLKTIFKGKNHTFYELTVSTPSFERNDLRNAILTWTVLLYVILLVIVVVICVWVVYRSMKPLYALLRWLRRSSVGKKGEPLTVKTRVTEFQLLNKAVMHYVNRAEELFEQQKLFIGNASHEIQTPLAICQNRLEMLLEEEPLSETQMEEIMKTLQTLNYISKLNKSLLLLSKIDNRQFPDSRSLILNGILKKQTEDYREVYSYKQIRLDLREEGLLYACMDESLATVLVTNLLKNAYIHTPEGGEIDLQITPRNLVFRNTAVAGSLNDKRIFERFYQAQKQEGSTGLGLALVKSICRMYGIDIAYRYDGSHVFELSFPQKAHN